MRRCLALHPTGRWEAFYAPLIRSAPMPALRRMLPEPLERSAEEAIAGLALGEHAPPGRPYVVANMVASADGRATVGGRSGGLGSPADRALFHQLRTQAEVVLVGTGTLAAERYGRLVRDPALRAKREREGLAADPLACVFTRSGAVPFDVPLFADEHSTIALYGPEGTAVPECAADVRFTPLGPAALNVGAALRHLRAERGVRSVLCEGGPRLLGALLAAGALDELFLTVSPLLAAGERSAIVAGEPLEPPPALALIWVLEAAEALFLRYRVQGQP